MAFIDNYNGLTLPGSPFAGEVICNFIGDGFLATAETPNLVDIALTASVFTANLLEPPVIFFNGNSGFEMPFEAVLIAAGLS